MPEDEGQAGDIRPDDSLEPAAHADDAAPLEAGQEAPVDGAADEGDGDAGREPSALEPGGKRFTQVYARAKDAERQLQQIREDKARLEGELAATRALPAVPAVKPEPRLTWTQLKAGIDDGKISEAQAMDYRDETLRLDLESKFEARLASERQGREHANTVQSQLTQYKATIPEIATVGTPERQRLEQEFTYLVSMGYDAKDPKTELLACRTTFGDVSVAKTRREAKTSIQERDTMQDIPANGKPKPDAKDPLKTITGEQRKYYQRMIDRGEYAGWGAVREELTFVPKR